MPDWAIWILVGLAFGALELATVGFFAALFALGALVTAGLAVFTDNWPLQAIVFTGASIAFMAMLRPYLVNIYRGKREMTAVDRVVGRVGTVVQAIDNLEGSGQIRANSEVWTARSLKGTLIAIGRPVVIVRIDGVKAIVEEQQPIEEERV